MFAIKLSMKKQIKKILAAWFSDLPAIDATSFNNSFHILSIRRFQNIWKKLKSQKGFLGQSEMMQKTAVPNWLSSKYEMSKRFFAIFLDIINIPEIV